MKFENRNKITVYRYLEAWYLLTYCHQCSWCKLRSKTCAAFYYQYLPQTLSRLLCYVAQNGTNSVGILLNKQGSVKRYPHIQVLHNLTELGVGKMYSQFNHFCHSKFPSRAPFHECVYLQVTRNTQKCHFTSNPKWTCLPRQIGLFQLYILYLILDIYSVKTCNHRVL
jgi:hypothetical protein